MNRIIISFCIFLLSIAASAQNYVKHIVVKSETVTQIAAKYKVTPYDIYKINPDAQGGIKENDVILVPTGSTGKPLENAASKAKTSTAASTKTHIAKAKETLYSISREYNVSVDDLKKLNPETIKDGVKIGQIIKIPGGTSVSGVKVIETKIPAAAAAVPKAVKSGNAVYHVAEAKETKFGIAKKYGITVAELEKKNPEVVQSLPIGYKLLISGNGKPEAANSSATTPYQEVQKPKAATSEVPMGSKTETEIVKKTHFNGFTNYEVKPKETMFSLAQMFDVSQDELLTLNPTLKDGVKVGMIIKVPGKSSMVMDPTGIQKNKVLSDLSKSVKNQDRKKLALLLPFNAAKIQGDTLKNIGGRLKKDAFLNMTLDFYAGALIAIDSAKALGLNIDVKIFDSEESKISSNVINVIQNNNLESVDAIVGPFYQQYVEKVAEIVSKNNVPVISPLSRETMKPLPNLYQSMPPADYSKAAIFDFMKSKNGNIIIVSDPKRLSNKDFILKNYSEARFVTVSESGTVDLDNLKSLLVKDRPNFVVLDTEKTGMILSTTNVLLNEMANFQIQIAIIEQNETLDFEEISMKRLTTLKLLYPSVNRENNSAEAQIFENSYKAKNKVFPSQYAIRGFDVTFDTMLRLSQGKTFETSANENNSEQVESKFDYSKKAVDGYMNRGVYILEYQEDLSVKQVN